jgi:hypothetical protein
MINLLRYPGLTISKDKINVIYRSDGRKSHLTRTLRPMAFSAVGRITNHTPFSIAKTILLENSFIKYIKEE